MGQWGKVTGLSLFFIFFLFSLFADIERLSTKILSIQPETFIWITVIISLSILLLIFVVSVPYVLNRQNVRKGKYILQNAKDEAKKMMDDIIKERTKLQDEFSRKDEVLKKKHEELKKQHAEKVSMMKRQIIELKETATKLMSEYKRLKAK